MIVEVKVFAALRHHIPPSDDQLENDKWRMPEGVTVLQVLEKLNIPEEEAKVFLINGRNVEKMIVLNEGDVLHIFPLMAGG